jgi:opacity protein-like surface antigen
MKSIILVALSLAAIGVTATAFAAANTVPASKAGDGAGVISGYTVSNVKHVVNGTNPRNIDSVTFDLDSTPPGGSTMKIKLVSGGSTWYDCTNSGASLTCNTTSPQSTVAAADELRVVVVP